MTPFPFTHSYQAKGLFSVQTSMRSPIIICYSAVKSSQGLSGEEPAKAQRRVDNPEKPADGTS